MKRNCRSYVSENEGQKFQGEGFSRSWRLDENDEWELLMLNSWIHRLEIGEKNFEKYNPEDQQWKLRKCWAQFGVHWAGAT